MGNSFSGEMGSFLLSPENQLSAARSAAFFFLLLGLNAFKCVRREKRNIYRVKRIKIDFQRILTSKLKFDSPNNM